MNTPGSTGKNVASEPASDFQDEGLADVNEIQPLDGEAGIPSLTQPQPGKLSRKALAAIALVTVAVIGGAAWGISSALSRHQKDPDETGRQLADQQPSVTTSAPRQLDMTPPPQDHTRITSPGEGPSSTAAATGIPAITPLPDETGAEPIGVRRTGNSGGATAGMGAGPTNMAPEDAPVLLVASHSASNSSGLGSTLANSSRSARSSSSVSGTTSSSGETGDQIDSGTPDLDGYQRQLNGLLDTLIKQAEIATGAPTGAAINLSPTAAGLASTAAAATAQSATSSRGAGLFGGQLQGSETRKVTAGSLGNRSLTLPKGTAFTCALKTKVISATSGFVGCQVQRNVYSDDGRVLLVERGSHMDGEYRITSVRPGMVRIPVLWTRIRTPLGVTVEIDSPGTGPLGESGIDGHVDNRWGERIGAALLLSLIDDSVKLVVANENANGSANSSNTVVLPSTTENASKLAEKVLDSTINIPPLIYQNQGGIVGIYVAHDVDFSSVYELQASPR